MKPSIPLCKKIFVGKQSQPDLQISISCLCTRVRSPDVPDRNKLKRLLQFLHDTLEDKLILSMDGVTFMTTWVDAYYVVHDNMRKYIDRCITLGVGMIHYNTSKHKLNL